MLTNFLNFCLAAVVKVADFNTFLFVILPLFVLIIFCFIVRLLRRVY